MGQNDNIEVIMALDELEKSRGISKQVLLEALEAALVSAFKRHYGSSQNVRISIDPASGKIVVLSRKTVVEEVHDPRTEVSLSEARESDPGFQPGDILEREVTPREFGRIAAQTAKQVVVQRIREAERGVIYDEFSSREGDVVTGVVQRHEQRNVIVDLGRVEATLPPQEQIATEFYEQGLRIKCYVVEVRKTNKGPMVLVSRTHPGLLRRLLELEVPEIAEGVVEIKGVAREAGARSKIAVASRDPNVDPVGACVGPRGQRIQAVVNELGGEKIDVIPWSEDYSQFVANALSPAKAVGVRPDFITKVAQVIVPDHQLSLAIGREGQNARLAAKITGWKIDIRPESQIGLGGIPKFEIDF
jgi:N utilization substance protein A